MASLTAIAEVLTHAASNNLNALLVGKHGVGKTALIKECFEKLGWNWKYLSASTLDPHLDLIGVPKEKDGILDIIRPADLDFDTVEAIFLDEYNRAPKKVRNAVMELIQFKAIKGKKFPKLKVVFAAINPDDDEELSYDVEKLDPAQLDRFQLRIDVPYEPCKFFFKNKFGHVGDQAVAWWTRQKADVQAQVSPRRLEAICQVHGLKGDIKYVVDPVKVNTTELLEALGMEDPTVTCDRLLTQSPKEIKKFFRDNNALKRIRNTLTGKPRYLKALIDYMPEAEIMKELRNKKGGPVIKYVANNVEQFKRLVPLVLRTPQTFSGQIVQAFEAWRKSNGGPVVASTNDRSVTISGKQVPMASLNICFTGTLSSMGRDQAEKIIKDYGGSTSRTVSFGVTHVVIGESPGAKLEKAKRQGCVLINQADWMKIVTELESPAALSTSGVVEFRGQMVNPDELTLDNFADKTGSRFRMEKFDKENGLSREEAFENFMKKHFPTATR